MIARLAPILFPVLWSTGWIVARFSKDFADPLFFLSLRYLFAGIALTIFAFAARAQWPKSPAEWRHAMISGVLLHTIYLGGVWWAIMHGLPASISALIAALQPIFTALLAPKLAGENIGFKRWCGVLVGFCGIALVLAPKLIAVSGAELQASLIPLAVNVVGMVGVTAGSFYQKAFIKTGDLRTVTVLQYVGAFAVGLPLAMTFGDMHLNWSWTAFWVMAWSVLVLSIGAVALLLILIRMGEVSRASQLIFLVPPLSAIQAFFLFGEQLTAIQIFGMAVTACGVALAVGSPAPK
jgi:drug/metabolite transporter (DMT)-like permease